MSKRNFSRGEVDLQCFGVIFQTVVSRELLPAPRVANPSTVHTFDNPKLGFGSPESAKGECGRLQVFRHRVVDPGNCSKLCGGGGFHEMLLVKITSGRSVIMVVANRKAQRFRSASVYRRRFPDVLRTLTEWQKRDLFFARKRLVPICYGASSELYVLGTKRRDTVQKGRHEPILDFSCIGPFSSPVVITWKSSDTSSRIALLLRSSLAGRFRFGTISNSPAVERRVRRWSC